MISPSLVKSTRGDQTLIQATHLFLTDTWEKKEKTREDIFFFFKN